MKDAIGGSLLLNIVVIITSVVILFFVGIIAYSKAYKIKNRIVEVIEKYETYDSNAITELENDLGRVGYVATIKDKIDDECGSENLNEVDPGTTGYLYCVYERNCTAWDSTGKCTSERSYDVVTYIHFNFPVIGDMLTFAVKGQTKTLGRVYDY